MLFLVAYLAEFRYLPGDSEWLTVKKKKSWLTQRYRLNSIMKSSRCENAFVILKFLSKVMLLLEIRVEKVLRDCLFHFYS